MHWKNKIPKVNLPKEVKDLYLLIESINKTLLEEIEDDQKMERYSVHGMEELLLLT